MPAPDGPVFEGELRFTVDGPGGSTSGTVRGDGPTLRVHADDPARAWDAAMGGPGQAKALPPLAEQLHRQGLRLEVSGPGGRVATVGAGIDSATGRLFAGSRRVQLGRPAAVRPVAVARLRAAGGRAALVAALVPAALAVAWVLSRASRRR